MCSPNTKPEIVGLSELIRTFGAENNAMPIGKDLQ